MTRQMDNLSAWLYNCICTIRWTIYQLKTDRDSVVESDNRESPQVYTLGVSNLSLRLGFDLSNNDYKVVVIAKNHSVSVNLYTLGTGS